jgi:hypothetical protein
MFRPGFLSSHSPKVFKLDFAFVDQDQEAQKFQVQL